jgi:hypothetical protein
LEANPEVAVGVLAAGAVRARVMAERKMKLVRDRMGLTLNAV